MGNTYLQATEKRRVQGVEIGNRFPRRGLETPLFFKPNGFRVVRFGVRLAAVRLRRGRRHSVRHLGVREFHLRVYFCLILSSRRFRVHRGQPELRDRLRNGFGFERTLELVVPVLCSRFSVERFGFPQRLVTHVKRKRRLGFHHRAFPHLAITLAPRFFRGDHLREPRFLGASWNRGGFDG